MTTLTLPPELADRLNVVARRLRRAPDECALAAIRTFVEDCEDNARLAAGLNPDGIARPPEDFWD
ncbi:hypothetical protein [Magnetospirillum moscoviense]|uniref:Uncharacterized protein n=1 Tax=Magnetospirillum moscoviense TaxID=1437059 RepID=A0A178MJE0_9PROT|nr:hypothetical protein [Magnetospirillum moscoviense]MBF0326885.1 hypothetical protein [Alphaproteobacteria bacterium]OAN48780.1 hypothetical protein A6A05_14475 [Magnetospirillum moscoviense]